MRERRVPGMREGFSASVRQRRQLCRVAKEAMARRELVWREHRFAEGKLDSNTMFERLRRHLQPALKAAEIRQAIGGFDISMNEDENGKFVPHWRPHAWILVATKNPRRLRTHLKTRFPASKRVRRPLRIVRYDGSPAALAYGLKTDFLRRVSLRRKRKSHSIKTRRNTRNRPLRSTQKVELALALHQAGLADRVFQFGRASVLQKRAKASHHRPRG
jgi:hypothetical protein